MLGYTSPQKDVVVGRMEGQGERMNLQWRAGLAPFGAWRLEESEVVNGK